MVKLAAVLAVLVMAPIVCGQGSRPNVILIMTDDQGYGDLGVTGNPVIRTPHIDALARAAASIRNFYVCPVCAPTRAGLMTGRYHYRTRVVDTYVGRAMMDPAETTVAELLGRAGYATGIFGKWHLGDCHPMRPIDQGFDEALVHRGGGIGQSSDPPGGERRYTDPVLFHNGERLDAKGYCTDVYFDHAAEWIARQHEDDKRFFAYIAPNCPHGPFHDVPEAAYQRYKGEDLSDARFPAERGHALPSQANLDRRARIFAMIESIDDNVGRLLARLDALQITDNTMVVFMVDNGPNGRRYVAGMRGQKGDVYEGGIRSPFFARWPARLRAGNTSDLVGGYIDVLPTILDACGVPLPDELQIDGRSLLPLLSGEPLSWPRRTLYIQVHRGDTPLRYHHFAARSQRWKLVRPSGFHNEIPKGDPPFELYDMVSDPLEEHDVAAANRDVVTTMRAGYDTWFEAVTAGLEAGPPPIHVGAQQESRTVLTRQDSRRVRRGGKWAPNSLGQWVLQVVRAGRFEIRTRFKAASAGERLVVEVGDERRDIEVSVGATSHVIDAVELAVGGVVLAAELRSGERHRGVHQVEVRRRGPR